VDAKRLNDPRRSIIIPNIGGAISRRLNKELIAPKGDYLKHQNKDMKNEIFELRKLNIKLMDKIDVMEIKKHDLGSGERPQMILKKPKTRESFLIKSLFDKTPKKQISEVKILSPRAKQNQKYGYTPSATNRNLKVADQIVHLNENIEDLQKDLKEALYTIIQQEKELGKYTDKTKDSIALKFFHVARINLLKNKVDMSTKSFQEINKQ
jgi:hypothetical protein